MSIRINDVEYGERWNVAFLRGPFFTLLLHETPLDEAWFKDLGDGLLPRKSFDEEVLFTFSIFVVKWGITFQVYVLLKDVFSILSDFH